MDFIVTDRIGIQQGVRVRSAYVVISIRDPDTSKARVRKQSGLRDVLYLAFNDTEPVASMVLPKEIIPMDAKQAEKVWAFVRQHQAQIGAIVVHCEQGMSRSPAVAAALCKAMGGDDHRFWQEYQPNSYVYRLVLDAGLMEAANG